MVSVFRTNPRLLLAPSVANVCPCQSLQAHDSQFIPEKVGCCPQMCFHLQPLTIYWNPFLVPPGSQGQSFATSSLSSTFSLTFGPLTCSSWNLALHWRHHFASRPLRCGCVYSHLPNTTGLRGGIGALLVAQWNLHISPLLFPVPHVINWCHPISYCRCLWTEALASSVSVTLNSWWLMCT